MAKFTRAKFLKVVDKVYSNRDCPLPIYQKRDLIHQDIFNARRKYPLVHITTVNVRGMQVRVEYMNGFVRVYMYGDDHGHTGWSAEQLETFSLGIIAANEILTESNKQGANKVDSGY